MRFWLSPLATGTDVPAIGVRALSPDINFELQHC
jgi:hypothetical protein